MAGDAALRRRLMALARQWLAHASEAEDVVQDTYVRTADGAMPAAAASREAWLVTVLRHLCIDAWRRQGRYASVLEQAAQDHGHDLDDDPPQRLAGQGQRVGQALRLLVGALPPGDVAAVLLYEVFGYSHAELGALAGRSEAASRQRLHRLLQRLRGAGPAPIADDEDQACLFALCRQALAQRDPALLVAVLRAARPQAMLARWQAPHGGPDSAAGPSSRTRLIQCGNQLALLIVTEDGAIAWLPLGDAVTGPRDEALAT
nr:RNA polymerase sigma factor [Bordetella petrii]